MSPVRKSVLASAAVLVLGAVALGATTQGTGQAATASSPIVFGVAAANQQQVQAAEKAAGHHIEGIRDYKPWDGVLFGSQPTWMRDNGHTLFLSIKAQRKNGQKISFASIAVAAKGSQLYTDMLNIAAQIKAFKAPVFITFNHEPEESGSLAMGNGPQFAAAWRKFVTVMRSAGVTNAKYVLTMTGYAYTRKDAQSITQYYPGDAYVDGIGADVYNWATCEGKPWTSMAGLVAGIKAFGAAHPSKGLYIMEYGSVEGKAGQKAQWLKDAQALFKTSGYSQFKAVIQWTGQNITSPCRFSYNTSASAQAAWAVWAKDPAFAAS
jgi:Glycosyl hydrolase family 26